VYFVGTLAGVGTAGALIQRVGHVRAFVLFALTASATTLGLAATEVYWHWFGLRLVTGYSMGAYYLVVESWINHIARNASRGKSLAIYESFRVSAIALSPGLLGIGEGSLAFALAGSFFLVAIIPIGLSRATEPKLPDTAKLSVRRIARGASLDLACCFVAGLISSAFYGLGAVYGTRVGLAREHLVIFMSVTWAAPLILQLPIGATADRVGRPPVILCVAAMAAAAAVLIALGDSRSVALLLALTFLIGGLSHSIYALGVGHMNDRLARKGVVRVGATLLLAYGLGTTLGPTLGSVGMTMFGPAGLYLFFASVLALLALAVLAWMQRRPRRAG
jgi:MFS family permease